MQFLGDPWSTRPDQLVARARAQGAWDALDAVLKEWVLSSMLEQRQPISLLSSDLAEVVTLALDAPPDLRASWGTMFDLAARAASRPNFGAALASPALAAGSPARALLMSLHRARGGLLQVRKPRMADLGGELERLHLARLGTDLIDGTTIIITPFGDRIAKYLSASTT